MPLEQPGWPHPPLLSLPVPLPSSTKGIFVNAHFFPPKSAELLTNELNDLPEQDWTF